MVLDLSSEEWGLTHLHFISWGKFANLKYHNFLIFQPIFVCDVMVSRIFFSSLYVIKGPVLTFGVLLPSVLMQFYDMYAE